MKKQGIILLILMSCSTFLFSQSKPLEEIFTLTAQTQNDGEIDREGYSVNLEMSVKEVKSFLGDRLKSYGSVTTSKGMSIVRNVTMEEKETITLYAKPQKVLKNQAMLWLSVSSQNEYDEAMTKKMLYELALELSRKDLDAKLVAHKKDYEKTLKETVSLDKKLVSAKKTKAKKEKSIKSSEKSLKKLNSDFKKMEIDKDRYSNELEALGTGGDSGTREKLNKSIEKASSKMIALQKGIATQEKKQLSYQRDVREEEATIKELERKLEQNKKEKQKLEEELEELNKQKAILY